MLSFSSLVHYFHYFNYFNSHICHSTIFLFYYPSLYGIWGWLECPCFGSQAAVVLGWEYCITKS
jgi:hypothetical protein